MKTPVLIFLFFLIIDFVSAQINPCDSTVQVIDYWDNKEKQSYSVSLEKYKIKESDTTSREILTYDVDITITDSTATSYTIEWFYKNCNSSAEDEITKKILTVARDVKVVIKTDEMGAFIEVVNWKEVRDYMKKATSELKAEFKGIPQLDGVFKQLGNLYNSKEAVESSAIKDIRQFYTYHGARYKLGEELSVPVKLSNLSGGEPFDAEVTVLLDEINFEDDNSILRMWQVIDSKQLTDAAYQYMVDLAKKSGAEPAPRAEMPSLLNETRTASRIHGPSGWVIYSVETKEVFADNIKNFEERIIEIK